MAIPYATDQVSQAQPIIAQPTEYFRPEAANQQQEAPVTQQEQDPYFQGENYQPAEQAPAPQFTPDDLVSLVNDPAFESDPTDQKHSLIDQVSTSIHDSMVAEGASTPEDYKAYAELVDAARKKADPSWGKSAYETTAGVVKGLPSMAADLGAGVMGASAAFGSVMTRPFQKAAESMGVESVSKPLKSFQELGDLTGQSFARNAKGLVTGPATAISNQVDPNFRMLSQYAARVTDDLYSGEAGNHSGDVLLSYLEAQNEQIYPLMVKHSGENVATANSLLSEGTKNLVSNYVKTRNPAILGQIRERILMDSSTFYREQEKQSLLQSEGAKAFDSIFGEGEAKHIIAGADPLNLAFGYGAVAKTAAKSLLLRYLSKEAAAKVLASKTLGAAIFSSEMALMGGVYALRENPNASSKEIGQTIAQFVALGGIMHGAAEGIRYGAGKLKSEAPAATTIPEAPVDTSVLGSIAQRGGREEVKAPTAETAPTQGTPAAPVARSPYKPSTAQEAAEVIKAAYDEAIAKTQADIRAITKNTSKEAQERVLRNIHGLDEPAPKSARESAEAMGLMKPEQLPVLLDTPMHGDTVAYQGYVGELVREGERLEVHTPDNKIIEVENNDLSAVTKAEPTTAANTYAYQGKDGWEYVKSNITSNGKLMSVILEHPDGQRVKVSGEQAIDIALEQRTRSAVLANAGKWADGVIKKSRGNMNMGIDPQLMAAYAVKGAQFIAKGFNTLASWSAAMLRKYGPGIRDYLADLWAVAQSNRGALNIGQGLKRGTFADKGQPSAIFYQGEGPYRVENPTARAILKGGLLVPEMNKVLTAAENQKSSIKTSAANLVGDLDAAVKRNAKARGVPVEQVLSEVDAGMAAPATLQLMNDPVLRETTRRARNFLDDMSTAIASITNQQTGAGILQNLGSWMRRGYKAFDPAANWNYDSLVKATKSKDPAKRAEAVKILGDADALLLRENPQSTAAEREAIMRSLTDRQQWMNAVAGGASKNVDSLMQRKVIPPELRALMGEETNPLKRFISSASFQAQFIALHEAQKNLRDVGLKMGIFSTKPEGVYTEQVAPAGGVSGERRSGFGQDLYTTPQMMDALANTRGVMTGTDLAGTFVTAIKFLGGKAKLNKVALSPDSWMVNLLGNITGLVATGDALAVNSYKNAVKAFRLMGSGRKMTGNDILTAAGQLRDAQRNMMARLQSEGVVSGGIEMQDVLSNLDNRWEQLIEQDTRKDRVAGAVQGLIAGQSLGASGGIIGRSVGGIVGAVSGAVAKGSRMTKAQQVIGEYLLSKPDNWAKITSALSNYETHLRAGMPDKVAFDLAVEKTMNTLPDYAKLPPLVRELSRTGVVGSFIAFQWEVYRNVFHNVRYAMQELRSGNPVLMQRGAQRLLGVTTILGMAALGYNGVVSLFGGKGVGADKDEAYRRALARPWDRFSRLAYSTLDGKQATYMNTSYLLPQATIMELVSAAAEGKTFEEGITNAAAQLADQFAGGSVHADPILEALTNRSKFSGQKISSETGIKQFTERLNHVLKATLVPGYVDKSDRMTRAILGRSKGDREFSTEQELYRLMGIREATYTHEQSMKARLYEFRQRVADAKDTAKKAYSDWGKSKPDAIGLSEQQRALRSANDAIAEVQKDYNQWLSDLKTLGISKNKVENVKKGNSIFFSITPVQITREGVTSKKP